MNACRWAVLWSCTLGSGACFLPGSSRPYPCANAVDCLPGYTCINGECAQGTQDTGSSGSVSQTGSSAQAASSSSGGLASSQQGGSSSGASAATAGSSGSSASSSSAAGSGSGGSSSTTGSTSGASSGGSGASAGSSSRSNASSGTSTGGGSSSAMSGSSSSCVPLDQLVAVGGPLVLVEQDPLSVTLQLQTGMDNAVLNINTSEDPVGATVGQPTQLTLSSTSTTAQLNYQATMQVTADDDIFQTITGAGSLSNACPRILRIPVLDADLRALVINTPSSEVWERDPATGTPSQFTVTVGVGARPLAANGLDPGALEVTLDAPGFDFVSATQPVNVNQAPYMAVFTLSRQDNNVRDPPVFSVTALPDTTTDPVWQRAGAVQQQAQFTVLDDERRSFFTAATFLGDLGAPAQMDGRCANDVAKPAGGGTYRAVVADGQSRCQSGGTCTNWPLQAGLHYLWPDGVPAGRANASRVIPVLGTTTAIGTHLFWTGLASSWATTANLCTQLLSDPWSASNVLNTGTTGRLAPGVSTIQDGTAQCNQPRELWCVEQ